MLAKPQTYMNLSGDSLAPLMEKHQIELGRLIVVYDELDLPWSDVRIKLEGLGCRAQRDESVIQQLKPARSFACD